MTREDVYHRGPRVLLICLLLGLQGLNVYLAARGAKGEKEIAELRASNAELALANRQCNAFTLACIQRGEP